MNTSRGNVSNSVMLYLHSGALRRIYTVSDKYLNVIYLFNIRLTDAALPQTTKHRI